MCMVACVSAEGLCNSLFGVSLFKNEDCYPSPSRWSECVGCRQMRVWHILRAASAAGKACPSSIFETRTCKTGEGCDVSLVHFPAPPDQPAAGGGDSSKETELMRPVGGIFLLAAVAVVFLLLAALEIWRRWGTSMAAQREVLNIQRQRDLIAAREQILEYRKMIQDYKKQLEEQEADATQGDAAECDQLGSFLMQHAVAAVAAEDEAPSAHSNGATDGLQYSLNSVARGEATEEGDEPAEDEDGLETDDAEAEAGS